MQGRLTWESYLGKGARIGSLISAGLLTLVLYRYGLLATLAASGFVHTYVSITTHFTAWYAGGFMALELLPLPNLFTIYDSRFTRSAFHTSLAGQPAFGSKLLQND